MPYDVAFRHQQAIDPSALVTIGASLHAITRAIDDCRNSAMRSMQRRLSSASSDCGAVTLAR